MHDWLTRAEFWAAHYYLLLGDEEHESAEVIESFFGVTEEEVYTFCSQELVQPDGSNDLLRIEFTAGMATAIEVADCGDSGNELRFYLGLETWPDMELIGYDSPHFALPALRWQEVCAIARAADHALASAVLLLLTPAVRLTSDESKEQVVRELERAWAETLVTPSSRTTEMATQIVENISGWDIHWWRDESLGWITDGQYSFRNPATRMIEFSRKRFERIEEFFALVS